MSLLLLAYFTASHLSSYTTAAPIDGKVDPIYHGNSKNIVTYVPRPTTRSTNELLTTCYITYAACVWKSIHANRIPSRSRYSHIWYKLHWAVIGVFAPEFVLWAALSQYMQAKTLQYAWYKEATKHDYDWAAWWQRLRRKILRVILRRNEEDEEEVSAEGNTTGVAPSGGSDLEKGGAMQHTVDLCSPRNGRAAQTDAIPFSDSSNTSSDIAVDELQSPMTSRRTTSTLQSTVTIAPTTPNADDGLQEPYQNVLLRHQTMQRALPRRETSNTHHSLSHSVNPKKVSLNWLPMVVAQFALMGGFVMELEDATLKEEETWRNLAHTDQMDKENDLTFGTRALDYSNGILEWINADVGTDFITTIRGRGFLRLIKAGAFSSKEAKLKLVDRYRHEIHDKCKADSVSKALVCMQVVWMLMNVIARQVAGLPITLLEVHVVIQVVITIFTYVLWWNKPLDAQEAIVIAVKKELVAKIMKYRDLQAKAIIKANDCCKWDHDRKSMARRFQRIGRYAFLNFPEHHIPDFITEATEDEGAFESFMRAGYDICETFFDLHWHTGTAKLHKDELAALDVEGPGNSSTNDSLNIDKPCTSSEPPEHSAVEDAQRDKEAEEQKPSALTKSFTGKELEPYRFQFNHRSLHHYAIMITAFLAALDGGLHLLAWNAYFPTAFESLVWKISCVVGGGLPIFLFLNQGNQLEYYPTIMCFGPRRFAKGKYTFWRLLKDVVTAFHRIGTMGYGEHLHRRSYRKLWPSVRLTFAYTLLVGGIVYLLALGFITVESGLAMRRLPKECYESLNWIEYFPHF